MPNPSSSRAEAAYARAMAAYQEGSYEAARRLTVEVLTEDPNHAGARALRARIDSRTQAGGGHAGRPGFGAAPANRSPMSPRGPVPEATSVDPTVLIDRADGRAPDYVEPTVLIQPEQKAWRRPARETTPFPTPVPRASQSVSQPTVLIPPKPKKRSDPSARTSRPASESFLGSVLLWFKGLGGSNTVPRAASPRAGGSGRQQGPGFWTPMTRGLAMVTVGLVVATLFVFGMVAMYRWMFPEGYTLTVTKPEGGTIVGSGIRCGTRGSDCSAVIKPNEIVDLRGEPDDEYTFGGLTGQCPTNGSFALTRGTTCGARFEKLADRGPVVDWTLTIQKPVGGSIIAAGGILCGKLGDNCTARIANGLPVTLGFEAEAGHKFETYTGDCAPSGETTMTAARTCGATFIKTETVVPTAAPRDPSPPTPKPRSPSAIGGAAPPPPPKGPTPAPPGPTPTTPTADPVPPTGPTQASGGPATVPVTNAPPAPKPVVAVDDEVTHAKDEINRLIKNYCSAHDSLKPEAVQKWYPNVNQGVLRETFKNYKSLKCTAKVPPEYERFDLNDVGAGGARVKFDMKQDIVMKVGGAPKTSETIVTLTVSRSRRDAPWLIDRVEAELKPK